jgi:beta-glucosidase
MAKATMYFPPDFLWGTATSAHQVEGDNRNNDWWQWEQKEGTILQAHCSGAACDWWQNAEADLDRAAEMGTNAHRLSLEWSRIEPEPSVFDDEALERYRQLLQGMQERGIEPMVTLHHFSNPLWLVEKGDFDTRLVVDYFQRYTAKVVSALGEFATKWITINEPVVYAFSRHVEGTFPEPKERGWGAAARTLQNMLRCHAAAYHTIKEAQPEALVGVAKNMVPFDPRPGGNRLDAWWTTQVSWVYNDWWMEAMMDGRMRRPLGSGEIKGLAGSFDFTGINYYTRFYTRFLRTYQREWGPDAVVSDGDYGEIYPQGLFRVIKHARRYQRPIYITENGVPDATDSLRPGFLLSHLREVWRAVSFNWPVMGYYHWSLVDNFEWDRGWTQRFGLIEVDPETQERRPRESARLYAEICQSRSISSDMTERYAPDLLSALFPG